ncbi:MAG: DNA mismatch repair endonuclease MutL [Puniceicoccales bacterium]|jgi:DNA mismatch repair protein MutL|nr:DNA mismatch repair endonuclease MutL [Puniceicoccales bacterium]
MPEIRVLPETVSNQIAAGEVVERPSAVVKELLENSLDAGATRIAIEFRHGGKSFISVEDNGCGMTPDQALMSLEMHATSKIRVTEDINAVRTFGFRGEAIPSIASISRFTMRTRPNNAHAGVEVFVNSGKFIYQKETGIAPGTRIEVANLFLPVPARLKFLKSENTEAAHITRLVRLYAVAQPLTGFTLYEDGAEIFRSPAQTTLLDRVSEIWGTRLAGDLSVLDPIENRGMRIYGLLGKPGIGRSTRQEMVTIVNGRPVDSRTLAYALVESYHTLLPRGRYPLAFIFLETDPNAVDINIHPAKREIRFRDESATRNFVITAVLRHLEALNSGAPPVILDSGDHAPLHTTADTPPPPTDSTQAPATSSPSTTSDQKRHNLPVPQPAPTPPAPTATPDNNTPPPPPQPTRPKDFRLNWRLAGHLDNELALFEAPAALIVLNLRTARERIWYERVLNRLDNHNSVSQQLLFPETMQLDPLPANTLREKQAILSATGFDIQEFGRDFFRIHAVPDWLKDSEIEHTLRNILAEIGRRPSETNRYPSTKELLAKIAATRAGRSTSFSNETATTTVRELFLCSQPTVSPNGKPTFFELTRAEISRRLDA